MASSASRSRIRVRPAKDEWGVYDPQQAGLAALFAKLDTKAPAAAVASPAAKLEAAMDKIEAAAPPKGKARLLHD
jgi:hypothetical protein